MKYKNVIWEGRFQPVHRGHLAYMRRLLELGERLWLFVVANETSAEVGGPLPVPEFTAVVDPHHRPEKNPLPFWMRYQLLVESVQHEFGPEAPIIVSGGRRLDLAWDLYKKLLPPDRVFITPQRDEFEDAKAEAWKKLGETCVRIDVSDLPKISATMIRDCIKEGRSPGELLSPYTERRMRELGVLDRLSLL
ncbi:adenylyltransferase/cytidyltransferase family protein [Myxococcus sp. AM001]|uniref:adenylyltransferase/cytidyltransferase family protein n=1 Tax=Myxococcus vastator TaxID=2709664 RepID=UPI0013D34201|nr:adenylyltransferase/cytidyltransferase family protein [Myxococcus vastator]NVJ10637.1 adenylyltransferase/cytidyltransferase family protein [Myxococcus sp. AM001]